MFVFGNRAVLLWGMIDSDGEAMNQPQETFLVRLPGESKICLLLGGIIFFLCLMLGESQILV